VIPLGDHNPTRTRAYVNTLLLVANVAAFLWEYSLISSGAVWLVPGYGMVPTRLVADPLGEGFTVLTSMFLHGSWPHLLGNMLFLYIFGDNVEDAMGHFRYAAFYTVSGATAATAQLLVDPASTVPMVGASGAIAGVLGAYLVLYPRAPVTVISPIITFMPLALFFGFPLLYAFPAWLVVGEWFVGNLIAGFSSLGMGYGTSFAHGGVAFFAHIGGFLAGLILVRPALIGRQRVQASRWVGWRPPPKQRPPWGDSPRRSGRDFWG
jgi:membrane associated rhomboid family serine protease